MKVKAKCEIDVIKLFLHEQWDCGPFDQAAVAAYLTRELTSSLTEYSSVEVVPPREGGLDRFVLRVKIYGGQLAGGMYSRRYQDEEDFRSDIPDEVYQALVILNTHEVNLSKEMS